jgi:transposase-like protein
VVAEEVLNLATLPKYLSDEAEAWALLERLRWPEGRQACPHCGSVATHYFISAKSGERRTKKGTVSYRRLWKCREKECRKQFSVLVGTIFESSKVPVSKWLLALYLVSAGKNGVSALELQRHLGLGSYQTAWFMAHRLREAMKREPVRSLLAGTVVADETFIGGKPKNKHQQGQPRKGPWDKRKPGGGYGHLQPVLALVDRASGEVRTRVVTDVKGPTLRAAMADDIDFAQTHLMTDAGQQYRNLGHEFLSHEYVNHTANEYVRGEVTTNQAESFFAQFKRSHDGTFHNVSRKHLDRYAQEFAFRWNTSKQSDHQRAMQIIDNAAGRRLTYRPVIEG